MTNSSTNGKFINFELDYSKLTSQQQAEKILKKAMNLITENHKGVAITYSANYGQTRNIEKTYFAGKWNTKTAGANQAEVISQLESLLQTDYETLQGTMHILPITTMNAYSQPASPWNDEIQMGIVITDLDRIHYYLEDGWCVLGWQNQKTITNAEHPYAVGGGVAQLPTAVSKKIQSTLIAFSQTYSAA